MVKKYFRAETAEVFPGITARNKSVLDYENFMHEKFYPYIIHPYSQFRVYWEILMIILSPIKLALSFFIWTFFSHNVLWYQLVILFFQLTNFIDVVLSFFSGYVESKTEIVVLSPKKIAKRILTRSLVFDVCSFLPVEFCLFLVSPTWVPKSVLTNNRACELIVLSTIIGVVCGVVKFICYLKNTAKIFSWNPYLPTLISILYYYFIVCVLNFGFMFLYSYFFGNTSFNEVQQYGLVGFLDMLLEFTFDTIFLKVSFPKAEAPTLVPVLTLNFFFSIFFAAYFMKYTLAKMEERGRFYFVESRVRSYGRKKKLPDSLHRKLHLYFQILLRQKNYQEDEILSYIPDTFKADIFFYTCLPLFRGFFAFDDFPTYVLRRLAEGLKYQLYLPNDVVMSNDNVTLRMYFIQRGTIALYSSRNVELYHFETGSSLNGRNFVNGRHPNNQFAVSVEVSEVYILEYEYYKEVMASYPDLQNRVVEKYKHSALEGQDFFDVVFDS